LIINCEVYNSHWGCHGRDRMVIGCTSTYSTIVEGYEQVSTSRDVYSIHSYEILIKKTFVIYQKKSQN